MDYFGKRYVFFKSLNSKDPTMADIVKENFDKTNALFEKNENKDVKNNSAINYMHNYLVFLQKLAANERANEIAFIQQNINLLESDPILKNTTFTQEMKDILQNPQNFNYNKMMNLLNNLRINANQYEQNLELIVNRLKGKISSIHNDSNFSEIEQIITDETKNLPIKGQQLRQEIMAQIKSKKNLTLAEQVANQINDIFRNEIFGNDSTILTTIKNALEQGTSPKEVTKIVENLVIKYVQTHPKQQFKEWLSNDLEEKIQEVSQLTYHTVLDNPKKYSIELDVIDGKIENLTNRFLEKYTLDEQQQVVENYSHNNPILKDQYQKLITAIKENSDNIAALKSNFTKEISKIIREKLESLNSELQVTSKSPLSKKEIAISNITDYFPQKYSLEIQYYDTAELLANNVSQVQQLVIEGLVTNTTTPGKDKNLKNDVLISWSFNQEHNLDTKYFEDYQYYVKNFMDNFLNTYYKKTNSESNVKVASEIYLKKIEQLNEIIKSLGSYLEQERMDKSSIIKQILNNTFLGGISVKEYRFQNDKIGFTGGSLGGGGLVINAIPNILAMYELGGITPIDTETIIEALLNCSSDMIGGSVLEIESLKDYLIGGAAMMMFDDGFSSAEAFLQRMKALLNYSAPRGLHLYQVQTTFIPASYVIQNIYENLTIVTNDIEDNLRLTDEKVSSSLTITNKVSQDSLPEEYQNANNLSNWEKYSQYAQNSVTITYHFLAGILDVLEQIPQAFNT